MGHQIKYASIAQLVEHLADNQKTEERNLVEVPNLRKDTFKGDFFIATQS